MEKEFQITIEKCQQVSPDDFSTVRYSLKADSNTTIGQIQDWICSIYNLHPSKSHMDFRVVELYPIPKPL